MKELAGEKSHTAHRAWLPRAEHTAEEILDSWTTMSMAQWGSLSMNSARTTTKTKAAP